MVKISEKIENLSTIRALPRSEKGELGDRILALQHEILYELDTNPITRDSDRDFAFSHSGPFFQEYSFFARTTRLITEQKNFSYLWAGFKPSEDELKQAQALSQDFDGLVKFRVYNNSRMPGQPFVALLYDNVRSILDQLGIEELKGDDIPESAKQKIYGDMLRLRLGAFGVEDVEDPMNIAESEKQRIHSELESADVSRFRVPNPEISKQEIYRLLEGGYNAERVSLLRPELQRKTLRESLLDSYQRVNGTLPHTAPLFDILMDYSKIVKARL